MEVTATTMGSRASTIHKGDAYAKEDTVTHFELSFAVDRDLQRYCSLLVIGPIEDKISPLQ